MRKIYFIISVALLLTGCTQETSTEYNFSIDGILAGVDNSQSQMRSTMIDSPTQEVDFYWSAGDAIGIFDNSHQNVKYTASATDIAPDSTTAVFKSGGGIPQGSFVAYYPYSADVKYDGNSILTLMMPSVQQYVEHHYKVQPDAHVNIMVGEGFSNNVTFKNVFAILKVGYVPSSEDVVKQIVFRDLSGQPVSGAFTVSMQDGTPIATFPTVGEGTALTLDCGKGVEVDPTNIASFFLVVPAREYAKGFQLDFLLASGETDSRTIGKTAGKTLLRSMVYSVGDVSVVTTDDYTANFGEAGGTIMDDDLMAMVQSVKSLGYQDDGTGESGDFYEIVIRKGTSLEVGQSLVINRTSEALPYGLIGRIISITSGNGVDILRVMQYGNVSQAFKSLTIGEENVVNADGSLNEDAVIPLDLTRYYTRFEPAEGYEDVDITLESNQLQIQGTIPVESRRASGSSSLAMPHISLMLKDDERNTVTIGAQAKLKLGVGASITDYTVHYIAMSITPSLSVDLSVQHKRETPELSKTWKLGRMYFTPITVGPLVVEPYADLAAFVSLKGTVEITAKWEYTMGVNFGAIYSRVYHGYDVERSVTGHIKNVSDDLPSVGDMFFPDEVSSSFGAEAEGGLDLSVGMSLYRLIDIAGYIKGGLGLFGGVAVSSVEGGWNGSMVMRPVVEGGVSAFGEDFKLATVDFEPFWKRNFYPWVYPVSRPYVNTRIPVGTKAFPFSIRISGDVFTDMKINYQIYRKRKGSDNETFGELIAEDFLDYYQGSPLFGDKAAYDHLDIERTFNLDIDKEYIYTIRFYCVPMDSRSPVPSGYAVGFNRGYAQIHYEKEHYTDDSGMEHDDEYLFIDDGNGHWILKEDGRYHYYPS